MHLNDINSTHLNKLSSSQEKLKRMSFLALTIVMLLLLTGCNGLNIFKSQEEDRIFYSILEEKVPEGYQYCASAIAEDGTIIMYADENSYEYTIARLTEGSGKIKELYKGELFTGTGDYYLSRYNFEILSTSPFIVKDSTTMRLYVFHESFSEVKELSLEHLKFYDSRYSSKDNSIYFIDQDTYYLNSYSIEDEKLREIYTENMDYSYLILEKILEEEGIAVISTTRFVDQKDIKLMVDIQKGEVICEFSSEITLFELKGEIYGLRQNEDKILIALYNQKEGIFETYMEIDSEDYYWEYYIHEPSEYFYLYSWRDENTIMIRCCDLVHKKLLYEDEYSFELDDYHVEEGYAVEEIYTDVYILGAEKLTGDEPSLIFNITRAEVLEDMVVWNINKEAAVDKSLDSSESWDSYNSVSPRENIYYGKISEYVDYLSKKYGVDISVGENAVIAFYDYAVTALEDETATYQALTALEDALSLYPEGFFNQFKDTVPRGISIHITGDISPIASGSIEDPVGFATNNDGRQYIVINGKYIESTRQTLTHELSHAIDIRLINLNIIDDREYFDEEQWKKLSPSDFDYYYSYLDENGESYQFTGSVDYTPYSEAYLENEDIDEVYFVDSYSKTSPTEDRARLMEYSLLREGPPDYMKGKHMQAKLRYYYSAIRKGWDTTGWPEVTAWEKVLLP
ncbi:MAG: hypothetical protein ACI33K_04055 [Clostridiaceae bacterium]